MRVPSLRAFTVKVLLVYAGCRLVSGIILAVVATRQVPTEWTGPVVSYLTFTAQWDGQWYKTIAEHGYPASLPVSPVTGEVEQNPWAFYPLFPLLARLVMDLTGQDFWVAGSTVSLLLGSGAALAMAWLLRDRLGDRAAVLVVGVWASYPAAVVLQVGYSEATAMVLLTGYLLALSRERWLVATGLALLIGLARPIAVPLGVVTLVAVWARWGRRREQPVTRTEALSALAAVLGCAVAGLLWPALAWLATGDRAAYPRTMAAWRASDEIVPFRPWLDMAGYYFGPAWGPVWLAVAVVGLVVMVLGPWAARLGTQLRTWSLAYPAYLLVVLDPFTSIFRYLIPMFPLVAVLLGSGGRRRGSDSHAWMALRAGAVLVLFVVGQWYWTDVLWRFVPPTDYPP